MRCKSICGKPTLRRFHISCRICAYRLYLIGKVDFNRFYWHKTLRHFIPISNEKLCLIQCDNEVPYVLFVDKNRPLKAVKDILLKRLWGLADWANETNRPFFRKYLLTLCEQVAV